MVITSIETIQAEAESAAQAGLSKSEACRFPFGSEAGRQWMEFYDAAPECFDTAVAKYSAAIGVAASAN